MSVSVGYESSSKPLAMENLEKQLVCPICLEVFCKPVVILPCQHNLCRKCANDVFQASNPYLSSRGTAVSSGGRFRCPSCRHEVVLDRHGVYGLQRNLLVENIIDMFKQESSSPKPEPEVQKEGPRCDEHPDERINIYCVTCSKPTCSLCKVFGAHKDCQVAPLNTVYDSQKTELTDCIAMMVGNNDRIQGVIGQLNESCQCVEENGRRQKARVCESFDHLYALLEERKAELIMQISGEFDEKTTYITRLRRCYSDHLEAMAKLLEEAFKIMEEPEMAVFLQTAKPLLKQITDGTKIDGFEKLERGYENMDHFTATFTQVRKALCNIQFNTDEGDEEEGGEDEEGEGHEIGGSANPVTSQPNPAPSPTSQPNPILMTSSSTPMTSSPPPLPMLNPTRSTSSPTPLSSKPASSTTSPAPLASKPVSLATSSTSTSAATRPSDHSAQVSAAASHGTVTEGVSGDDGENSRLVFSFPWLNTN